MNIATPNMSEINSAEQRNWHAKMITPECDKGVGERASFVQKTFQLDTAASGVNLYISALGLYRCFINGKRVGDDALTPGWTSYDKRLSYQTYDVSDLLTAGENTIQIWLADGWYRSQLMWRDSKLFNTYGEKIGAIAELVSNGEIIAETDDSWSSGLLPVIKSGIYFGEIYDARAEDITPTDAVSVDPDFDFSTLIAFETNGVKELPPHQPVAEFSDDQGRKIIDFAQNCAGYVSIEVSGEAGARFTFEHAEILDENGQFENSNMRSAEARIEYVCRGGGKEQYTPIFSFQGFRFVRMTIEGDATLLSIKQIPITSAINQDGWLETGNPLVNRLVLNTIWSHRSNFVDVPTDCPQRDERLGWTGDAQVFVDTACYLHEGHSFWVKWLRDLMADQRENGAIPHFSPDPTRVKPITKIDSAGSTGWGDAICVVPWALYMHYGDKDILAETYVAMQKWVDFVWSISDGPIVSPPRDWARDGFSFGDWLQPKGPSVKPLPTIGDDAAATIYLYISCQLVAKVAAVLGDNATRKKMLDRAADVKAAFQLEFVTPSGRLAYDDQTSYALAFVHDLIPEEKREAAKKYFIAALKRADFRIQTGFIGTPVLLPAILKIGEPELAQHLLLQEEAPGWLYQVKMGATSIWERWDALSPEGKPFDPAMNSYNHYAYGAVCQWLFEAVAGMRPDESAPGFSAITFSPTILPALSPIKAVHDTPLGQVEINWTCENGLVTYDFVVPEGATGAFELGPKHTSVQLNGKPLIANDDGQFIQSVSSGRHQATFSVAEIFPTSADEKGASDASKKAGWQSL